MKDLYQYNATDEYNFKIDKINDSAGMSSFQVTFDSPFLTGVEQNDRVYSEFFFPDSSGTRMIDENKTKLNAINRENISAKNMNTSIIILLHGFASKIEKLQNYYSFIDFLIENGKDCAFLNQPFHLKRTPVQSKSGEKLIYVDDFQTLEFYHQAVVDTRRLIDIAISRFGYKKIILCGFSMGSMVATIASAVDSRINKTILLLGGGDWYEIHWNSILAYVLKGNCIKDGMITKRKCREIYQDFPEFLKEFKKIKPGTTADDYNLNDLKDLQNIPSLKEKTTKACFLCDPLAFGHLLDPQNVLMINSKFDHYFSGRSAKKLWIEIGKPEIFWFNRLHSSKILLNARVRSLIIDFLKK